MLRSKGSSFTRGVCFFEGCKNKQHWKGYLNGNRYYGKWCNKHRKIKNKDNYSFTNEKKKILNEKCTRCGWKEGPCDRHRINNKIGYLPENIIILCPNCHRLVTLRIIKV